MEGSGVPMWVRLWNRPQTRADVVIGALIAGAIATVIFVVRRAEASVVVTAVLIVTAGSMMIGELQLRWRRRRG